MSALICFLLALFASALPFFTGTVYYMVADDYLLNYIANGSYGAEYSDHLIFLRMPAGVLLRALYGVTTSVNWYLVLLLAVAVLSFATLHFVTWKRTGSAVAVAVSALVNVLVIGHFLSFTVVAFLAAAAGIGGLVNAVSGGEHVRLSAWMCAAYMLVSWCLRENAAYEAALIFLPLFILSFLRLARGETGDGGAHFRIRGLRVLLAPVLCFLAVFLLFSYAERRAYSSPKWQAFRSYDEARSLAVDYPAADYDEVKKELKAIGVTHLDRNLLVSWRYAEKSFFTEELLREVAAIHRAGITAKNRADSLRSAFGRGMLPFLLAPLVILLMLILSRRERAYPAASATLLIGYGLLFAFAYVRMRFVMRVALPTQLLVSYALLLTGDPAGSGENDGYGTRGRARRLPPVLTDLPAAVLIALFLHQYLGYYESLNYAPRIYCEEAPYAAFTEELASHPDTLYVLDSSILSRQFYFGTPASQVKTTDRFRNIVRSGSWDSYSPRYYEQVGAFLDDPDDLLRAIVAADNVAVVTQGGVDEYMAFYRERTGRECVAEEQPYPECGISVWHLSAAPSRS